jgi:hypothetical protein
MAPAARRAGSLGGIKMAKISIDNGNTDCGIKEAISNMDWDIIVSMMDDDIREQVHSELAPCTEEAFLTRYLELAKEDLIIG